MGPSPGRTSASMGRKPNSTHSTPCPGGWTGSTSSLGSCQGAAPKAAADRLLELHGVAGAIGEQLGLAWAAGQDVQRFVQTSKGRPAEYQRLIQRALAEMSGHFVLSASHSRANFVLRLLLLNPAAKAVLVTKANVFPVFSNEKSAWISLNHPSSGTDQISRGAKWQQVHGRRRHRPA
jgi:hypothetical protein